MKHTEMIMVIEAHSEGKAIEVKVKRHNDPWDECSNPVFDFHAQDYRVKPEPKYHTELSSVYQKGTLKMVEVKAVADLIKLAQTNIEDMSSAQCKEWEEIKNLIS